MNNNHLSAHAASKNATGVHRTPQHWRRLPLLLVVVAMAVGLLAATALADSSSTAVEAAPAQATVPTAAPAAIYLGFKSSDEIEIDDEPDFRYKNEDIVGFIPSTGDFFIFFDGSEFGLSNANLDDFEVESPTSFIFTLRGKFTIPGLGQVDDSDVVRFSNGVFSFVFKGADVGLTKGAEDIDALGFAEDGKIIISTIGTAKVPGISEDVKDQDLIKLESSAGGGSWSLYFDGSDVKATKSAEDIRSTSVDTEGDNPVNQNIYLTFSGNFDVESTNDDEGDKNDVEGCFPDQVGTTTACFFFKLLDGEDVGAENQLDGLSIIFDTVSVAASAATGASADTADESAETAADSADFVEAMSENDSEITADDFIDVVSRVYLPRLQR